MLVEPIPKPTKQKRRNSHSKQRTRQQVKDRDGDSCLLCGRPGPGLHLHRVVYGSQGGKYVPENCVLLCHGHHNPVVHASKETWQPLLLEYLQGEARADALRTLRSRFAEWLREKHPTG